ncbi:nucleotidyltransferase family protein [Nocardioides plantarum]|uniref:nucleotidyltransferase family protein n=1 Tax=Nocardioides plantarum TaxID=29299 RepID=UPI0011238DA0|nr:nucleotidyltransferase family protein [Nocardioides plantarum]
MTAGVLLAAGGGSRMGTPKALVRDPDGTSWLLRSIDVLREAGCDHLLVVLGAAADEARALLPDPLPDDLRVVVADDWATGMAASLSTGLSALQHDDGEVALITLVDLPDVGADVARRVLAVAAGPDSLARATYDGRPGHPVLMGREHWFPAAATVEGDAGAKDYLREHGCVGVECGDLASGRDVDSR